VSFADLVKQKKREKQTLILRFSWQYQPTYRPQKGRKIKKNRSREKNDDDDDDDIVLFPKYLFI
jgi:hypothetical protein